MKHDPIIEAYRICRCAEGFMVEARIIAIHETTTKKGFWPILMTIVERRELHQWHTVNQHGSLSFWGNMATFKDQKEAENFCEYLSSKDRVVKEYIAEA